MTVRKTSLLLASTSAVALSILAYGGIGSSTALASCTGFPANPPPQGGAGYNGLPIADDIVCTNAAPNGGIVNGNGGNDTITTNNATQAEVNGGNGADTIILNGPGSANNIGVVTGGKGDDSITLDGADITTFIDGGQDDDTILLVDINSDVGDVFGGTGEDTITLNGAQVGQESGTGLISGGLDNDQINLISGGAEVVEGGKGEDEITQDLGSFTAIVGDNFSGGVNGKGAADLITLNDGVVDDVWGQGGEDTINLDGTLVNNDVHGGKGDDLINLDGSEVGGDIIGWSGEDTINIIDGTVTQALGGGDNDTIVQKGGTVAIINGQSGQDFIDLQSGVSIFAGGGSDNDVIALNGAASIIISGQSEDDTILLNTGLAGGVEGGTGNDTIALADAAVVAIVGDSILDGVAGPGGNDVIDLNGGLVVEALGLGGAVWGQGGDDIITLDGSAIENDIQGGLDNDTINLFSGEVTDVWGDAFDGVDQFGSGNDLINLGSAPGVGTADVLGQIVSGAGSDTVNLLGGTVALDVLTGSGEDSLTVDGALIIGSVDGESSDDMITMTSGTVGGALFGGSNNDAILFEGGSVGGDVSGQSGNDLVELAGGVIGGDALGGSGDDIGGVLFDFDFDDLSGGTGVFAGDENTGDGTLGDDELFFAFWEGSVNANRLPEWEEVAISTLAEVTFTGGTLDTDGNGDIEVIVQTTGTMLLNNDGLGPDDGDTTIAGNLTNEGLIDLSGADGGFDNVLTVTGNYAAASDLYIDTFLNDGVIDITDQLQIGGNATGETLLTVIPDPMSPGGLTGDGPTDGILVVGVGGVSDDDAFSLTNADLVAGIFEYELVNPEGQPFGRDDWYLQSDWLDQIYVYETLPGALQTIGAALSGQLVERVGVRSGAASTLTDAAGNPVEGGGAVDSAVWARAVGLSLDSEGDLESTTNGNFNQTIGFVQGGVDIAVLRRDSGRLVVGALGHWGTSTVDVNGADNVERGSANFDYYGGGLTATWYGASGLYFDNVVQYTAYDIDISTATRFSNVSTDGWGFSTAHEVGYRIPVGATTAIVPQAQITYQTVEFDDFVDPDGVLVSFQDDDSLIGRLGVAVENNAAIGSSLVTGYLEANVIHEFLGDNTVNTFTDVGGTIPISQDLGGTSVELGFGGTIAVNQGVSLYAEVDYTIPFDNGLQGFQALGGIRVNLNPAPPPPPPPPAVVVEQPTSAFIVFFDWDRADLTPEANLVLDDVVVVANEAGYASIRLDGYTDLSGSAQYNLGLSERRANSVANGLIARGIAPDEIVIRAFGEENPLVPTPDGVREPQNRRVEIFLS